VRRVVVVTALMLCACTPSEPSKSTAVKSTPATSTPATSTPASCRLTPGGEEGGATAPAGTPSLVRLGPGRAVERTAETVAISRRGEPLLVTGAVRAQDCRTPLAGATVEAWQTDATGRYGPGEACCYLQGVARTDGAGRYTFETVVPGSYAGPNPPPRHIHLIVSHPRARSVLTELLFAGDPDVSPSDPLAVTLTREGSTQRAVFDVVLRDR
jgi:protocatechuate 3,4-dioxygenase beta subunit